MAYVDVIIHTVWSTKNRYPYFTQGIKQDIIHHILANARKKGICIDRLNGGPEHLHCLFRQSVDLSISKTMQLLKGEASHWINYQKITPRHFDWGKEYFAVSVSKSLLPTIRRYIDNQEKHHSKISFSEEYESFLKKYVFCEER